MIASQSQRSYEYHIPAEKVKVFFGGVTDFLHFSLGDTLTGPVIPGTTGTVLTLFCTDVIEPPTIPIIDIRGHR